MHPELDSAIDELIELEPDLSRDSIIEVLARSIPNRDVAKAFLDHLDQHPGSWTTGAPAPPVTQRTIRELLSSGANLVAVPCCAHCRRPRPLAHSFEGRRVCVTCYANLTAKQCIRCGKTAPVNFASPDGPICARCRKTDPTTWEPCVVCRRPGIVTSRTDTGEAVCSHCYQRPKKFCDGCGSLTLIQSEKSGQRLCRRCDHGADRPCGRCGRISRLSQRATESDVDLCTTCYDRPVAVCVDCGQL